MDSVHHPMSLRHPYQSINRSAAGNCVAVSINARACVGAKVALAIQSFFDPDIIDSAQIQNNMKPIVNLYRLFTKYISIMDYDKISWLLANSRILKNLSFHHFLFVAISL